jgi:hypothetical protein
MATTFGLRRLGGAFHLKKAKENRLQAIRLANSSALEAL